MADVNETLPRIAEQFGDGLGKPENKVEMQVESTNISRKSLCGWLWYRPSCLQRFRTAKWALFWLCWAGALQGIWVYLKLNFIGKIYHANVCKFVGSIARALNKYH